MKEIIRQNEIRDLIYDGSKNAICSVFNKNPVKYIND